MSDETESARETASGEPRFEEALEELRAVVADLEGGRLGLEASLTRFEDGVGLLKRCHATLERAERRVELLTGTDADGQPVAEPFDASATAERGGAGRRGAGKKRPRNRERDDADGEESAGLF